VLLGISFLQVIWRDACVFGNSSEHLWADLVSIVECENEVWITGSAERAM
jgi:hypothetical protein